MHVHHSIGPRLRPATAFLTLVLGSATLIALIGCGVGGGSSISGKVTHKNEPVKGGSLTFVPIAEGATEAGKPAAAEVGDDGTYRASVTPGKNKVSYSAPVADLPEGRELKPGESPPLSPWHGLVPKQQEMDIKSGSTVDIELVRPGSK